MKVYVAMPITGGSRDGVDYVQRFLQVAHRLERAGFEPVLPVEDAEDREVWVRDLERLRFREACTELVQRDLERLREADAVLAFLPFASIGVAMEICYGRVWGKYVLVVVSLGLLYHPWIWYHANRVVWSDNVFQDGMEQALYELHISRLGCE